LLPPQFLSTLTPETTTFSKSNNPILMKNYAQAILQFTGYPLEPIVALQINKSFQSRTITSDNNIWSALSETPTGRSFVYQVADMDERWFTNYE
jgi:hypothetical protein